MLRRSRLPLALTAALTGFVALPAAAPDTGPQERPEPSWAGARLRNELGCLVCHAGGGWLAAVSMGPPLWDAGDRLRPAWIAAFLRDPQSVQPGTRMPRMGLGAGEIADLAAFLATRSAAALPPAPAGDAAAGAAVFARFECLACHRLQGAGDARAGTLDFAGAKLRPEWVPRLLQHPGAFQPAAAMPEFPFQGTELDDLSAFISGLDPGLPAGPPPGDAVRGFEVFVARGCAACHLVLESRAPGLESPSSLGAHLRGRRLAVPRITVPPEALSPLLEAVRAGYRDPAPEGHAPAGRPGPAAYWSRPLAPQEGAGTGPGWSADQLQPEACGACHPLQYYDWKTTRHSLAGGPGVEGQLLGMSAAQAAACRECHAPLAEQAGDPALRTRGVVCAACHLREGHGYGPPSRFAPVDAGDGALHGEVARLGFFQDSRFCAACHQFEAGQVSLNGKLLQDTYEEWKRSPAAAAGRSCQDCHMPGRRHLFRGIHDADMVREGLALEVVLLPGEGRAEIRLANQGAGHSLPTYVTPAIFVRADLLDAGGEPLPGSRQEFVIQRRVSLTARASTEVFDSRIPAGGKRVHSYDFGARSAARFLRVRVEVEPDHFYAGFFQDFVPPAGSPKAAAALAAARQATRSSAYRLYERILEFPQQGAGGRR